MIEDDLRASFARHETLTPDAGPVRDAINSTAVRRRRRRFVTRMAGAAVAVLVAVSMPVLGRTLMAAPTPVPETVGSVPTADPSAAALPDSALNFLLIGVDGEAGGRDVSERADSVLIVHVPRDRSRMYLVSLPRDLGVEIPGHGFGKLNAAFFHGSHRPGTRSDLRGGARLTVQTVTNLTGLRFDGSATLTFSGLRGITDAVGGVRLCLPRKVQSVHTKRVFPAGCQQLDGAASLDLLRQRYRLSEGAHERDRNGQRFTRAILTKVSPTSDGLDLARSMAILAAVDDGVVLDTGTLPMAGLFAALQRTSTVDPVGIGWTYRAESKDGQIFERLDPLVSGSLFEALRRDTLAAWTAQHPAQLTRWQ